jgi:hypothetical protein
MRHKLMSMMAKREGSRKLDSYDEKRDCFRWVNTVLGNVKTAIVGTLKSVAKRYVYRYLAALPVASRLQNSHDPFGD